MRLAARVRTAADADVASMHRIRLAVRENQLSDPGRISERDYLTFVEAGSAWVVETPEGLVGFGAIDKRSSSVWALFLNPKAEGLGLGRALHEHMICWARDEGLESLSLRTSLGTRAERFYRAHGWSETSRTDDGEIVFALRLSVHSNSTMT